jgi:hypothetical protein
MTGGQEKGRQEKGAKTNGLAMGQNRHEKEQKYLSILRKLFRLTVFQDHATPREGQLVA